MVGYVVQPCGINGLIDPMWLAKKILLNVIRACCKQQPRGARNAYLRYCNINMVTYILLTCYAR